MHMCCSFVSLPKLCSLLSHGSSSLESWHGGTWHYSSKREFVVVVESAVCRLPVLKPIKNLGHVQACPDLEVIQLSCHPVIQISLIRSWL